MIEATITDRHGGGFFVTYTGTREELIEAGIASDAMFSARDGWHVSRPGAKDRWINHRTKSGGWELSIYDKFSRWLVKNGWRVDQTPVSL